MERIEIIKMSEISDNAMNHALTELYEKQFGKYQLIIDEFGSKFPLANIYLLATSDSYFNSQVRVMILGKETMGWGSEFDGNTPSVLELQKLYFHYTFIEKGNGAAFQRFVNWIQSIEEGVAVMPNNVVKIGKKYQNGHYAKVASICNEELPLLREEILITKPNVIVCPTSNFEPYNLCLTAQLGKKVSEESLDEHICLRYYASFPDIPFIICPHPQGKSNEDLNRIKEIISRFISVLPSYG